MPKRIMLTLSDKLYEALSQKTEKNGYMTTQELINDIIRKTLFRNTITNIKLKKSNAGRPKRINPMNILTRKIFKKNGDRPQIL